MHRIGRTFAYAACALLSCTTQQAQFSETSGVNGEQDEDFELSAELAAAITQRTVSVALSGQNVSVDLYFPTASSNNPAVVIGHGFARNKGRFRAWGQVLAGEGYVVAVPTLPGGFSPNFNTNAAILNGLMTWLINQSSASSGELRGKVNASRIALMGHSAGGLASLLAASTNRQLAAVIGLDLTDRDNISVEAARKATAPLLMIRSSPASCNSNGNGVAVYEASTAPKMILRVVGANHCDPESPSDFLCALGCGGGWNRDRHQVYQDYARAMLDWRLKGDVTAKARLEALTSTPPRTVADVKTGNAFF